MLLALLALLANCRCPEPKAPAPPPTKIVEVVKPCSVEPPKITLTSADIPDADASGSITFTHDQAVRLAESIRAWSNFVTFVQVRCGSL
jgi:hypothetical protein